ncbi:MAG TPA: hypothetical protein PKD72_13945, partial [Gemmatales bacterium]|nr:hypothetical protein [Gemmatales bacterium]
LRKLAGQNPPWLPAAFKVPLAVPFRHKADRPTYYPVKLTLQGGYWQAHPLPWKGSGDLRTLTQATSFAILPPVEIQLLAGDEVEVLVL